MKMRSRSLRHRHYRTEKNSSNPDTVIYLPRNYRILHKGIRRSPRESVSASLPVSEPQAEVLAILTHELQRASDLAKALGLTGNSVTSRLYALQSRGLAERVPNKGWKLT